MDTVASDMKVCPYCAEDIKAAAIKCRYCQSDLTDTRAPGGADGPPAGSDAGAERRPPLLSRLPWPPRLPQMSRLPRPGRPTSVSGRLPAVSMRMLVVLLVVSLLAAVTAGYFAWNLRTLRAEDAARTAGQVTAANYTEKILSYSYKTFDRDEAQQRKLTTGTFARQYAHTMKMVRGSALRTHTVVKANVVASSIVSAQPDQVKALLFLNQTTTGTQTQQPRVDLNRVVVTLTKGADGDWLVSQLNAL